MASYGINLMEINETWLDACIVDSAIANKAHFVSRQDHLDRHVRGPNVLQQLDAGRPKQISTDCAMLQIASFCSHLLQHAFLFTCFECHLVNTLIHYMLFFFLPSLEFYFVSTLCVFCFECNLFVDTSYYSEFKCYFLLCQFYGSVNCILLLF